ncbi:MAG TPA: sulfatase [Planctomycetota bacterium]|nr:sulfatase [Planctomycetota bacterium]
MIHAALLSVVLAASGALNPQRPNILWLSCEDIGPALGCYGEAHAITPELDALASQGVRYTRAFTIAGVCAPCRSSIITGLSPTSLGTHPMRSQIDLPAALRPFPALLREAGYHCTNNAKTDYQFSTPADTWDHSGRGAHWRERQPGQPFFAVFNFTGCHESGIVDDAKYERVTAVLEPNQRRDPSRIKPPPYYPDTPAVREDLRRYHELITAMDHWIGLRLAELEADGLSEETIVFFWSDHGAGLPRAKRWVYDSGTHVPLIVRVPERFRIGEQGAPGSVDGQLVSSLDLAPTVLPLAGAELPAHLQGRAFLGSELGPPRAFVFGVRDRMDERNDIVRSVRGPRFRYVRNFEPWKPYAQYLNTPEKGATMQALRRLHATDDLPPAAARFLAPTKPSEELYDLERDPFEVRNLAGDPDRRQNLLRMGAVLEEWMIERRDLGLVPESDLFERARVLGTRWDILRRPGGADLLRSLLDAASLAAEVGETARAAQTALLARDDAALRFWGAIGLGNQTLPAAGLDPRMMEFLEDPAPCVRIAAARAVARGGHLKRALAVLTAELRGANPWARLEAVLVLDELDEAARPAQAALEQALVDQPNKYIVRVANRALNELLETDRKTR